MGYRTPNIDRLAKEGVLSPTIRASRAAPPAGRRSSPARSPIRTGLTKVGLPGAKNGLPARGPDDRRPAQGPGLRDRPVRQEPPRRPQRVPADGSRLRRVLRQPVPPQRRGRTREPGLPQGPGFKKKFGPRGVTRTTLRRDGQDRQADDRGHRPAQHEADGDRRRGVHRRDARVHRQAHEGRASRSSLVELHAHAHLHAPRRQERKGKTGLGLYPTAWSSTTAWSAQCSTKLKDLGIDDNTIVMYTTDNGAECSLARRRHHAVPGREEHELGGRLPRAVRDPLAGRHQARHGQQRHHLRTKTWFPTLVAAAGDPDVKEQLLKGKKVGDKTFKVHLDGYNITDCARRQGVEPAPGVLLLDDDGSSPGCDSTTGRSSSSNSGRRLRCLAGAVRARCVSRSFNLRATRSSGRTRRSIGYDKWRIDRTFLLVPGCRHYVGADCLADASRNSHRARRPAASSSTRCWKTLRERRRRRHVIAAYRRSGGRSLHLTAIACRVQSPQRSRPHRCRKGSKFSTVLLVLAVGLGGWLAAIRAA